MHIKKATLQNFKFHSDLTFDISKNNCLIYGENGTGKSSISEAFYAVFKTYFRNNSFDFQKFKKSRTSELRVEIIFNNDSQLVLPNDNYTLPDGIFVDNKNTIYFANHDLLEFLVGYEDNFYVTIKQHLKKYFDKIETFCETFDDVNRTIDSSNYVEKNNIRQQNSEKMSQFLTQVVSKANDIIQNHFQENFEISFQYDWGMSNTEDDYKFPTPKITLQIDNKYNLKLNFNEAKLKLSSIALFFALIKLEENSENPLKLLVLDDFLTSLDMANRHYIMEYIFTEFSDYQKIILTHNLQFYNLILKLLKSRCESEDWDNKNIFVRNIDGEEESLIYDKEVNYMTQAGNYLTENRLDETGIYLRKEFERIIEELRQINEVGAKEKISKIVNQLLTKESYSDVNTQKMQKILTKTKFYQDVLLHSTAHDDINNEKYKKELKGAIVILEQLNGFLRGLRGD